MKAIFELKKLALDLENLTISKSTLSNTDTKEPKPQIEWVKPDLKNEVGEYFENEDTQRFLYDHGFEFKSEEELLEILERGQPSKIDKRLLKSKGDNLTLRAKDFESELGDPEYARSYQDMKKRLLENKKITLPMPIILKVGEIYWGFAGNRRMNLAWGLNLPVLFYVVDLGKSILSNITELEEQVDLEAQFQTFLDKYSKQILADVARGTRVSVMQNLKKNFPEWTTEEFEAAMNLIGSENFEQRATRLTQDIIWFALEKLSRV